MEALIFFILLLFAGFVVGAFMMWNNMRKENGELKNRLAELKSVNTLLWQANKTIYDSYQEELRRRHD